VNPRKFPALAFRDNLIVWRQYLDMIIEHVERVADERSRDVICGSFETVEEPARGTAAVLLGVRTSWYAHVTQQFLDAQIVAAKQQWRTDLRDQR
jgi:hypothetical protein